MKPRDIFGLAVRLMGLFFLYLGLKAVTPMLDLGAVESASKGDIVNAVLPIVFNLTIAWWLLGGGLLMRRAYPDAPKASDHPPSQAEPVTASPNPARAQELTDMDRAEKKLASLVEKPKDGHAVRH